MVLAALQDQALVLLLLLGQESCPRGRLKDLADTMVGLGRAFEIFVSADLLANFLALCRLISVPVLPKNAIRLRACSNVPARVSLAFAKFWPALQWSFGRVEDRSCTRPG